MSHRWRRSVLLAMGFAGAMVAALAQAQPMPGGPMQTYDPSTETTLKGTIEELMEHEGRMGWKGLHLRLKTETETLDVHLGPLDYVTEQGFTFAKGDAIEVLGSRITFEGNPAAIAREIRKGDKTLILRDATGRPAWAGGRWRWEPK